MRGIHVALFCSIPVFTILAPAVKEIATSLLVPSYFLPVYEGDGVLVGDTGARVAVPWWLQWPSALTINWQITQRPAYGDAYHAISLFMVPKSIAHRFLYRFDSNYSSDYYYSDGTFDSIYQDMQHLDLRSSIYLLPKEYSPGRVAKARIFVTVRQQSSQYEMNDTIGSTICQFQNREYFRNFVDMEPRAIENSKTCNCELGGAKGYNDYCSLSNSGEFTSTQLQDTFNYFSAIVPTMSFVKFEANITMYFYSKEKLIKYAAYAYLCTIRGTDTCSFITTQTWFNPQRQLILAYIHPRADSSSKTSTLAVKTDVLVLKNAAHLLLYLLIPIFLIKTIFVLLSPQQ